MTAAGLWMLLALGVLIVSTGLPVWALLIGVASAFSVLGLFTGHIDVNLLTAAPSRAIGLLEHDLLQALPLYVLVGMLLQRLAVADAIFNTLARLLRFTGAGVPLAALGTGALLAPMNGSVASSSALLSRVIAPRLQHLAHIGAAKSTALVAAAATIGVVVPPSLVLLLLGDAMLRAHLEAGNLPGATLTGQRIVNTQDILSAALLPACAVLALWAVWLLIAYRQPAKQPEEQFRQEKVPLAAVEYAQAAIAFIATAIILTLLGAVFTGAMFAVEAAATGCCLLIATTLVTHSLSVTEWRGVVQSTLALTGALIALLVAATMFSLVFRGFGTDQWLANALLTSGLSPWATAAVILTCVALCACVLDAFEMIFVIIPVVAPPLIASLGDASQAAVLLLLLLQLSFVLPPMGYAVLMARAQAAKDGHTTPLSHIFKQIMPFASVVIAQAAIVFIAPSIVHQLDKPGQRTDTSTVNEADIVKQMQDMAQQAPAGEKP